MSKNKSSKTKRRIVSTNDGRERISPTTTRSNRSTTAAKEEMLFGKENYKWMGIGVVLVAIGMMLMMGGEMPSPDVWDEDIIYSFRRVTLAPFVILAGLIVEIYAIFIKKN